MPGRVELESPRRARVPRRRDRRIAVSALALVVMLSFAAVATGSRGGRRVQPALDRATAAGVTGCAYVHGPVSPSDTAIADGFVKKYEQALGVHFHLQLVVRRPNHLEGGPAVLFAGGGTTSCDRAGQHRNPPAICDISIYPGIFGVGDLPAGSDDLRQVLAHEVFHCFQSQLLNKVIDKGDAPDWLIEGGADWAACAVQPTGNVLAEKFHIYLDRPERPLDQRSYDAVGFFDHLQDSGIDPFQEMKQLLTGTAEFGANDLATGKLTQVLGSWASSFFEDSSRGGAWDGQLHCNGDHRTAAIEPIGVANGQTQTLHVGELANEPVKLTTAPDILTVAVRHGYLRISGLSQSGLIDDLLTSGDSKTYCLKTGGCTCPGQAPTTDTNMEALPFPYFALTGGTFLEGSQGGVPSDLAGDATLTGMKLQCHLPRGQCGGPVLPNGMCALIFCGPAVGELCNPNPACGVTSICTPGGSARDASTALAVTRLRRPGDPSGNWQAQRRSATTGPWPGAVDNVRRPFRSALVHVLGDAFG